VGAARSVGFSVDGEMVAVGLKNGEFMVLSSNGLKIWGRRRDRAGSINDVRYSSYNLFISYVKSVFEIFIELWINMIYLSS